MEGTYNRLGSPGIFRNDRFWLAGDHVVDPRIKGMPAVKRLIESSEKARKVFKMTEYQGMNVCSRTPSTYQHDYANAFAKSVYHYAYRIF